MVTLILLRHATAAKPMSGQPDHDRPLTPDGRLEAQRAGMAIAGRGSSPDLVLCSTARRTRETLAGVLETLGHEPELRFLTELFDSPDYRAVVQAEADDAGTVMVIGHNPFIQDTAVTLADGGADESELGFPPAAFAVLTSPGGWPGIGEGRMRLDAFVRVKL